MKSRSVTAARVALGLIFFVLGLNGFLHFLPQPPLSGPPAAFLGALVGTGYMIPLLKGTEVAAGVLLLLGRYVPLALTLLAPVIVNIVAFHAFLAPSGIALPLVVLALEVTLAWAYRASYRTVLEARVEPTDSPPSERTPHRTTAGAHA
jgi:uncharacterized membrane protein YphA (DoxX/SURF4 family)